MNQAGAAAAAAAGATGPVRARDTWLKRRDVQVMTCIKKKLILFKLRCNLFHCQTDFFRRQSRCYWDCFNLGIKSCFLIITKGSG